MVNRDAHRFNRRVLLKAGTVGLAGAAFSSDLFAAGAEAVSGAGAVLSVGFWNGMLSRSPNAPSVSAAPVGSAAMTVGDPSFIDGGAVVRVRDLYLSAARKRRELAVSLDAIFRPDFGADSMSFNAWSYVRKGNDSRESSPIRFTMPVDVRDGFELEIRSTIAPARSRGTRNVAGNLAAEQKSALRFTVGHEADRVKLLRGTYFVALRDPFASSPLEWSAIRTAETSRGENFSDSLLYSRGILDERPVDFDYIVLEIEPVKATA